MLEYTGTEYIEKQYGWGPAPDFDPSQWTNEKFTLGMEFPNVSLADNFSLKMIQGMFF